ncbi:UNVERIFIED_CONTAM: hypothetical protein Scaly_2762600 [Sesamum calycinum]|uniref:Cupin type-1 domain-containing protein n=1 Tax=Sesamum calycinum TaxID=2727403 RepID=A0AAW2IZ09_9LAMI
MELDLTPKLAKKLYGGDGGAYYAWCPNELPMLREGNIGAAKLALEKNGFALPRYSDSAKVAYVLQGSGVAGIVLPEKEEKEDTELVVLFLGDTSKAHKSGSFTDFFLTGSNGIFTGFSTEFVSRAGLGGSVVKTLVGSQSRTGIVKLDPSCKMPEPKKEHYNGMALNCEEAPLDVDIKDGGRLNGKAMCSPGFSCDSALQVTYIVRGSGRVQIADPDGMDWFSIITTPNPVFTHLAGRTSVWKALSPEVLQAAFGVPPDVEQKFSSKRKAEEIFFPPPN